MKIFGSQAEVAEQAKKSGTTLVTYKSRVLDVTQFKLDHPGGDDLVENFNGQDISAIFHDETSHQHSRNALNMMSKFQIGSIGETKENQMPSKANEVTGRNKNDKVPSPANSTKSTKNGEVNYPIVTEEKVEYEDYTIDLRKGVLWQMMKLPIPKYLEIVHNPVHVNNLRLFDMDFFEFFSHTKWYVIPIFWFPIIFAMTFYTLNDTTPFQSPLDKYLRLSSPSFSALAVFLNLVFGLFVWTKTEYVLHRFLFHLDDQIPNSAGIFIHFLFHGIHHFVPMDKDRLVFPPAAGVFITYLIYLILGIPLSGSVQILTLAGLLTGYIGYDCTHYYIHHGKPFIRYFEDLKGYHGKHHYKNHRKGFGVSNKMWDHVYGTLLV